MMATNERFLHARYVVRSALHSIVSGHKLGKSAEKALAELDEAEEELGRTCAGCVFWLHDRIDRVGENVYELGQCNAFYGVIWGVMGHCRGCESHMPTTREEPT